MIGVSFAELDTVVSNQHAVCETEEQLYETVESRWMVGIAVSQLLKVAVFSIWDMILSVRKPVNKQRRRPELNLRSETNVKFIASGNLSRQLTSMFNSVQNKQQSSSSTDTFEVEMSASSDLEHQTTEKISVSKLAS